MSYNRVALQILVTRSLLTYIVSRFVYSCWASLRPRHIKTAKWYWLIPLLALSVMGTELGVNRVSVIYTGHVIEPDCTAKKSRVSHQGLSVSASLSPCPIYLELIHCESWQTVKADQSEGFQKSYCCLGHIRLKASFHYLNNHIAHAQYSSSWCSRQLFTITA